MVQPSVAQLRPEAVALSRALLAGLPEATLLFFDAEFRIVFAAGVDFGPAGVDERSVVGRPIPETIPQEGWRRLEPYYRAAIEGRPQSFDYTTLDGKRHYWIHVAPLTGGGVAIMQNVTQRRRAEMLAHEQEQRLSAALSGAGLVLFSLDQEARFTLSEGEGLSTLGLRPGELVGRSIDDVYSDSPEVVELTRRALAGETLTARLKLHGRVLEVRASPLLDDAGRQVGVVGVGSDVTDDEFARRRLRRLAYRDPLTRLPNRLLFERQIESAIARARNHDRHVVLLYIDLDDFKVVNDSLGHTVGDRLLADLAARLRALTHRGESVGRQGGDSFLLLVPDVRDDVEEVAAAAADRVATALEAPFRIAEAEFQIEASVGISIFPDDASNAEELLAHADSALHDGKRLRRGGAQRFQSAARQPLARLSLAASLRHAAEAGELVAHYQPVYRTGSGELAGAEALVRWEHPERGLLLPGEFLPLAEEMGTMHAIGACVFEQVCALQAALAAEGRPVHLAVNVSLRQLRDARFSRAVAARCASHGLDPHMISFEITETAAMTDARRVRETLHAVSELGMRLCIDDFGSGFSSLSRLREVPVDVLKVDRSLLRDVVSDRRASAILEAITALARSLDMFTVVEGLEDAAQLEHVRALGCDYVQGFHLGRPMPAEDFAALVRQPAQYRTAAR